MDTNQVEGDHDVMWITQVTTVKAARIMHGIERARRQPAEVCLVWL